MTNKNYLCRGENFRDNCRMGYCGQVHTLLGWFKTLLPNKTEQEIKDYFEGDTDRNCCDYIYTVFGKRLEATNVRR